MSNDEQEELSLTPSVRRFILASYREICQECGADDTDLEIHHITPKAEGGSNHPSNLTVLCKECHKEHHSSCSSPASTDTRTTDLSDILAAHDIDEAPADSRIVSAVESNGPSTTGEIAETVGVTSEYVRRRLYALGSAKVVAKNEDGEWDRIRKVKNPVAGKLPDDPEKAARFARDDIMRRMKNAGMSHAEIAEVVGLAERTVPTAINRARTFDPPIPPMDRDDESGPAELHRQLRTLLRRVDELETRLCIQTAAEQ